MRMEPDQGSNGMDVHGKLADELILSRYLSERSPVPTVAVEGLTHIVRYVNPAFCRLADRDRQDLIDKPFALAVPEAHGNGCIALLDNVYRNGGADSLVDQPHLQSPSLRRFWSYTAWAVLDANERPAGVMIQITDTTEQTLARHQLSFFNQALLVSGMHQHELTDVAEAGILDLRRALRETERRAKNSLQIVTGLLDRQITEKGKQVPVKDLVLLRQSIQTLASLQDVLTHLVDRESQAGALSAAALLGIMLPLWQGMDATKNLEWRADEIEIPVKQGMSLALLINELITNAEKHGGRNIELTLVAHDNSVTLIVSDDGPGFPTAFDALASAGSGLEFAETVVRLDLSGSVAYDNRPDGGARVTITFPLPALSSSSPDTASIPFSSVFAPSLLEGTMRSFAAFANLLTDHAILLLDERGHILRWSLGAERLFGYSVEEALGKPLSMLFASQEEAPGHAAVEIEQAIGEGHTSDERWMRRKDGSQFFASGLLTALTDSNLRGFVRTLYDITPRKQAEEALQQSRQEFAGLVEHLPDIIFRLDTNLRHLYISSTVERTSGVPPAAFLGKTAREIGLPEAVCDVLEACCREALERGEERQVEYVIGERQYRSRLIPERTPDSRISSLLGITEDITERKQADAQMQVLVQETAVLQERTRIAQDLHDSLAQTFTGIKYHMEAAQEDLYKSPAQAEILLIRACKLAREGLQEARRAVRALRSSGLEASGLAEALEKMAAQSTPAKGIRIGWRVEGAAYPLPETIENELYRIAQEALTNALRHARAGHIDMALAYESSGIQLRISDNGLGFDTRIRHEGFGMKGMRERAARIGGALIVRSQSGKGTEVVVTLPIAIFPKTTKVLS